MNNFPDTLDRLKRTLGVSKDGEVAGALGLSKTAFSERKRRNSFPEQELRALAAQRPELGIDVEFVLTGQHRAPQEYESAGVDVTVKSPSGTYLVETKAGKPSDAGDVQALPTRGGLAWEEVLVIVVDELHKAGKTVPGDKLVEVVNIIMEWQRAGARVDKNAIRAQLRLVA